MTTRTGSRGRAARREAAGGTRRGGAVRRARRAPQRGGAHPCFAGTERACARGSPAGHGWPAEWARTNAADDRHRPPTTATVGRRNGHERTPPTTATVGRRNGHGRTPPTTATVGR